MTVESWSNTTPAGRVLARVAAGAGCCWVYTGPLTRDGYGCRVMGAGVRKFPHVWTWEERHGAVPKGLQLDHLCRSRRCVNPDHLEPVTPRENTLRGETLAARNVAKTHCPQGHPLSGENLYVRRDRVGRGCRTCLSAAVRRKVG